MERRRDILSRPVEDIHVKPNMKALEFHDAYSKMGGFMASHLAKAVEYLVDMLTDKSCTIFLAFTANIVATGLRGIIADIVRRGLVDVIVTTGGTVDHDVARAVGGKYFHGDFSFDDVMLRSLEIHRLGNVLVPIESYGPIIEKFTFKLLNELIKEKEIWTPSEILHRAGQRLEDENSILSQAALRGIPVFSPGIVDSAFGTNLAIYRETLRLRGRHRFILDVLGDMSKLSDIIYSSNRLGALILGGGISKHHVIWWSQFKEGLDYAVYITTAVEWDGSLSGATTREAISWGKLKPSARHVTVYGEATIILPILTSIIYGKLHDLNIIERKNSIAIKELFKV